MHDPSSRQRLSTRLGFLAAGMGMSAWAALVPFAQARLALDQGQLGLLLLCLGIGSLVAMPVTGALASRFGCRLVVLGAGALVCLVLPALALAATAPQLALALLLFGAGIGTLDVAINIQAVIVEKAHGGALMSGFHGLFSVGGVIGAGGMAALLWAGLAPLPACLVVVALVAAALLVAAPHLLRQPSAADADADAAHFAVPHGAVILIGLLCFIAFLAEGAILDWSALLLTTGAGAGMATDQGGIAYAVFASAMTVGRLTGDRVVARFGAATVMLAGGLCTAAGFFIALVPLAAVALPGFLLIGLGAANIVPILFTAAGRQRDMPAGLAISAISTIGYAGILAGPALIGLIAHASSLQVAFAALGCAMLLVAASRRVLGAPAPVRQ